MNEKKDGRAERGREKRRKESKSQCERKKGGWVGRSKSGKEGKNEGREGGRKEGNRNYTLQETKYISGDHSL